MEFCLPINLKRLQNDRLYLVPIEDCADDDLEEYVTETGIKHPELFDYFPSGPFTSLEAFKSWYDTNMRHNPSGNLFAIYLKAGTVTKKKPGSDEIETFHVADGTFAGVTGLIEAVPAFSVVEIGHVMVLSRFQRTFVNTHATCLLLKHALDPLEGGDLNMRRVQWQANSENKPSLSAARRLGFNYEGTRRWQRTIADHKKCVSEMSSSRTEGKPVIDRDGRKLGPGRHSAMFAMCWDDWLDGTRDHVMKLLE